MTDALAAEIDAALAAAALDRSKGINALTRLAYAARDADDFEGFGACLQAFDRLPPEPGQRRAREAFTPSRAFYLMYEDDRKEPRRRILILRERHGIRHLEADGPDGLARAALWVLAERMCAGWYDEGSAWIPSPEGPVARAYLDAVRSWGVIRHADPEDSGQIQSWRRSSELKELKANLQLAEIVARLTVESSADDPRDDRFIAFLGLAAIARDEHARHAVADLLRASRGPLASRVARTVPPTDLERARAVLAEAASGNIRRAGRIALDFLFERRDAEYEHVEIQKLEVPDFDPSPWLPDVAPKPD